MGEHLARQRNVVHFFQGRNEGRVCLWMCLCPQRRLRHRDGHGHGHMHKGYDGALYRPWPYGYVLGKGIESYFGIGHDDEGQGALMMKL